MKIPFVPQVEKGDAWDGLALRMPPLCLLLRYLFFSGSVRVPEGLGFGSDLSC